MTDAWEGYAQANGITKRMNKLSDDEIAALRARIKEEQRKDRLKHGNH